MNKRLFCFLYSTSGDPLMDLIGITVIVAIATAILTKSWQVGLAVMLFVPLAWPGYIFIIYNAYKIWKMPTWELNEGYNKIRGM